MKYQEFASGKLLFIGRAMICVFELLAVLVLVATGTAIMVGALSPGDALRRVGVVLLLLLIVPMLITGLMQAVVAPMLAGLRSAAGNVAGALVVIAGVALAIWLGLYAIQRRSGSHEDGRER